MKKLIALTIGCLLVLTACGDDDSGGGSTTTSTVVAGVSGTLSMSGGIEGRQETWVLEADGTVLGPDGYTGTVSAADRDRLAAAVEAADFFTLDAEYLPEDQCCDRFTYVITIAHGGHTHTVTTIDAAEAPEGLFDVIGVFLDVVRPAA